MYGKAVVHSGGCFNFSFSIRLTQDSIHKLLARRIPERAECFNALLADTPFRYSSTTMNYDSMQIGSSSLFNYTYSLAEAERPQGHKPKAFHLVFTELSICIGLHCYWAPL